MTLASGTRGRLDSAGRLGRLGSYLGEVFPRWREERIWETDGHRIVFGFTMASTTSFCRPSPDGGPSNLT